MSQLIHMRQRIKAIETIKKVTHAMRLISMSSHSRLRHTIEPLAAYRKEITSFLNRIHAHAPTWHHPLIDRDTTKTKRLVLLVGSQKGLCGSFNTTLFKHFDAYVQKHGKTNCSVIAIGKKAVDHARETVAQQTVEIHPVFGTRNLPEIAHVVTEYIADHAHDFGAVEIISSEFVSFFLQRPHVHEVVPIAQPESTEQESTEDYLWEMKAEQILDSLVEQYLESAVMHILYQSLLAEHAARFLSMDNSTRNAQNLLEETQLKYNKLRQAKITKELTELSASFQLH